MSDSQFFQEATLLICGSVEIEKALFNCIRYISRHTNAESVYLHFIEPKEKKGTVIAMANRKHGQKLNVDFSHPSPVWQYMGDGRNLPEEMILNRANQHPVGRKMLEIIGLKAKHAIVLMRLILDGKEIGVVGFGAKGWNRFSEEDLQLLRLLKAPFAIALSNSIRYLELLKLKNLLADDNEYLQDELRSIKSNEIIGADFGLSHVMRQIRQVAPLSSPVLLTGETGVGKEVIANAIHNSSTRRDGPLIKVNCGAIPETLIDSELFGHEKGAFTGASGKRRGRFERAHGGTIFLDEIGELPMTAQIRLLRVLQEKEFEPVGADFTLKVDIRVIAATHRNLEAMIKEGSFRKDLYFRLNVFPVHIPTLRERRDDIPALAQYFMLKKYREMGIGRHSGLSDEAIENLKAYHWPGNIRELENVVEREIIISNDGPLRFRDIDVSIPEQANEALFRNDQQSLLIDDILSAHIKKVLALTRGRVGGPFGAATMMGMNANTLRHKMRKLGIAFGRASQHS